MFVPNRRQQGDRNSVITRTLRKVGFIDNKYPRDSSYPNPNEHWLVEIARENTASSGGCFILEPVRMLEEHEYNSLVHGMYTIEMIDDAILLTPEDDAEGEYWVISPEAKRSILESTPGARSIVINHGGEHWKKRRAAESILSDSAKEFEEHL